jgi:hypothetical protein
MSNPLSKGPRVPGEEVTMKSALKHVRYVLGSMSAVLFSASAGATF